MARATAALVVIVIVFGGAMTARGHDRLAADPSPPTARGNLGIGSSLGYGAPSATPSRPRPTDPVSVSSSPAADDAANPLGSGAGIIVLVAIGGGFLWLRSRATRR